MGLTNKPHRYIVGFLGFVRRVLFQGIIGLELHSRSGKILGQPVVNLVGNDLPFVVAGLEHSPKRLPFPLQGFLCTFAIRNVSVRTDESVGFALVISQYKAMCHDPAVGTVFVTQPVLDSDRGQRARKEVFEKLEHPITFVGMKKFRPIVNAIANVILVIAEQHLPTG